MHIYFNVFRETRILKGWREGSAINCAYCSFHGPVFNSWNPHSDIYKWFKLKIRILLKNKNTEKFYIFSLPFPFCTVWQQLLLSSDVLCPSVVLANKSILLGILKEVTLHVFQEPKLSISYFSHDFGSWLCPINQSVIHCQLLT